MAKAEKENTEQWIERVERDRDIVETHPSYGVIGISHVSGQGCLFNSDVRHQHFIEIRISEAQRIIGESGEEMILDAGRIIEVGMSEAQFAQFVTQPNRGSGVPCTIKYHQADKVTNNGGPQPWLNRWGGRPSAPEPEKFEVKFHQQADERTKATLDNLKSLEERVNALFAGTTKPNKANLGELKHLVYHSRMQFESNLPYVLERAAEELEKKISDAVVEFEGYVAQSLQAKGLQHLKENAPQLQMGQTKLLGDGEVQDETEN